MTVLAWLAHYPMFDVILVEQDSVPRLRCALPHPRCRHVFAYNPGPFNKSWGLNIGYRLSDLAWFAFGDADVILGDVLPEALRYLSHGFQAVKPYRNLIDLDARESKQLANNNFDRLPNRSAIATRNREGMGEFIVFAGGVFLITRAAFTRIGGWDERFCGWGGEDDAMSYKIERSRMPAVELDQRPAVHLWHARSAALTSRQPYYASNCAVLEDYRRLSDAEMVRMCEIHMQIIGEHEKYRPQ